MSEANIKRKNCLYLFANIVIGGFAAKIKSCHWCSIYYWKKFFLASILGVKDPFIPFDNFRTKLLNSKATECRSLLFIPGPGCRIQEWMLLPIFDIGHCSAAELCRGCSAAGLQGSLHLTWRRPASGPRWSSLQRRLSWDAAWRDAAVWETAARAPGKYNHHLPIHCLRTCCIPHGLS